MPLIFRKKKHDRRSKRYHSDEINYYRSTPDLGPFGISAASFDDASVEDVQPAFRKRSTGSFHQHERPKSEVPISQATADPATGKNQLDQPLPSRNVRTAPPTPEVESKAFPRHAESTSHLEMATPSIPITTTTTTTPSTSQALPVAIPGVPGRKPRETANLRGTDVVSSGQKSPHKEVSPKIRKSRNEKFHKLFKAIPHDEILLNAYSCAYFGDILLQGYLYISPNWFCFYSKILAHQKLIQVPVSAVINITREKTAFIIPNAIKVRTAEDKFVFGSLISRDNTYKLMWSIWKKARSEFLSRQGVDIDGTDGLTISYGGNSGNENNNVMKPTIELTPNTSFDTSGTDDSNSNLCLECEGMSHHHQGEYSEDRRKEPSLRSKRTTSQCYNSAEARNTVGYLVTNMHKMPKTNLLLAVCAILAIFLVMSAVIMAYKIMTLQSQIETPLAANGKTSAQDAFSSKDWLLRDEYYLNNQYHVATVEKFHTVLQANIQLLGEVHESLKNLQSSPLVQSNTCISTDQVVTSGPKS